MKQHEIEALQKLIDNWAQRKNEGNRQETIADFLDDLATVIESFSVEDDGLGEELEADDDEKARD